MSTGKISASTKCCLISKNTTFSFNRAIIPLNECFCSELVPYDLLLVVSNNKSILSFYMWCMLGGSV